MNTCQVVADLSPSTWPSPHTAAALVVGDGAVRRVGVGADQVDPPTRARDGRWCRRGRLDDDRHGPGTGRIGKKDH